MRIEKLRRYAPWQPQEWEVFAPAGMQFHGGMHSRVCKSASEAKHVAADESDLDTCSPDCDCHDE